MDEPAIDIELESRVDEIVALLDGDNDHAEIGRAAAELVDWFDRWLEVNGLPDGGLWIERRE